jgi:hypothetical protein
MKIKHFPRHSLECFTLTELRIISERLIEFSQDSIIDNELPFLKWEQTLVLQKFTPRTILDFSSSFKKTWLEKKIKSHIIRKSLKNPILLDFESIKRQTILDSLNINIYDSWNPSSMSNTRSVLLADKRQIDGYVRRCAVGGFRNWVGFNPNVRIQVDMNDYLPLSSNIDWRALFFF